MLWKKIKIKTITSATDIVALALFENDIVGAEIEDNVNLTDDELKQMFVDIPVMKNDDGIAYVCFYVAIVEKFEKEKIMSEKLNVDKTVLDDSYISSTDNIFTIDEYEKKLQNIKNSLCEYKEYGNLGDLTFDEEILDDKLFLNKWKENFKRINFDNVCIIPNFDKEPTSSNKLNIYIEPGSAFGTGQHATTKLCINNIVATFEENKNVKNFLDIGTGSGILSIVAYKLGAKNIYAVDADSSVKDNLIENLKLNGINKYSDLQFYRFNDEKEVDKLDREFFYGFGNIITDKKLMEQISQNKYDVITINILAPVIISMFEKAKVYELLDVGGKMILSGIIKEKEVEVLNIVKKYLNIIKISYENEWVSIVGGERFHTSI